MRQPENPSTVVAPPREPLTVRDPVTGPPVFVDTGRQLEHYCRRWSDADALAVDTEFVRERTYYPALGLIQVSDGRENVLIDPVALVDLDPLRGLFAEARITKVFHSCSEDMEALYHRMGDLPRPIFDTQIAATLTGLGYSLGLSGLVETLFGVEIPKQQTRTNWLRRPLSSAQKEYAALDVAYLLPAYDLLRGRLSEKGRQDWAREEFELSLRTERFESDPEDAFGKFRRIRGLDRRQLAILRTLVVWREKEARHRDLPRNFVLHEAALPELARKRPRSYKALREIGELRSDELNRHGRTLLALIRQTLEMPKEELPERPPPSIDLSPFKPQIDGMRRAAAQTAQGLELPTEVLATRRTIEKLARRAITGREPLLPSELRGWRRDVIGESLLSLAAPLATVGEL